MTNPDRGPALSPDPREEVGGGEAIGDAPSLSPAERIEFLALELRTLAFRMQVRVDHCVERDGIDGAVTGRGVGISYLFAHDIAKTLDRAADFVDAHTATAAITEAGRE